MAYSGEGNLIEAVIEGDVNRTVIPVVCDSSGHLVVDLTSGAITIGTVNQGLGGLSPWLVSVNNFPATQPVSGTVTVANPGLTDTQLRATPVPISGSVSVSNFPATQPVSGTVAVTQSTSPWVVDGSGHTQPVSGTVTVGNAAGASAVNIQDGGNSITVDGAVTVSGTATVSQATGTNLHTVVDSGSITATVSGTVTATPVTVTVPLVGQAKIAVTGTAVQLSNQTTPNGVILTAKSTNVAVITVGASGVTNTVDGTGNGYLLEQGCSVSAAVANVNDLYINGTAGDIVSWMGS
jgi:hypothetical protein